MAVPVPELELSLEEHLLPLMLLVTLPFVPTGHVYDVSFRTREQRSEGSPCSNPPTAASRLH